MATIDEILTSNDLLQLFLLRDHAQGNRCIIMDKLCQLNDKDADVHKKYCSIRDSYPKKIRAFRITISNQRNEETRIDVVFWNRNYFAP